MPTTIAQEPALDLFHAVVVAPSGLSTPENKAVEMLVEEVAARSLARWTVQQEWPADDVPVVAVGPADKLSTFAPRFATEVIGGAGKPEGYRLKSVGGRAAASVLVVGDDARGVLFGCGRLLREMLMTREAVQAPAGIDITDAPKMATRGHQLGFRPKVNSYDGWTPVLWEQYYRDLIVFGTNAVELIPPRSDDDAESPHFPLPKIDMMVEMSQLAKDYGLDLWIWYPAMDRDYADPATVESALKEWGEVFQRLPHISTIFVPGGDPGHTHPEALFNLLAKQTENLHQYHPNAQMWMSPQSFNPEWMEVFYGLMQAEPQWLGGIVYGPQNRVSLPELREKIPAKYPIREYPDITHSLACQYAVPDWDPAYALTENREVINPRPTQYAHIFRDCDDYAHGVITYSEGCNDDVNKIVWSALSWDPGADVVNVLRAYARYFIGPKYEESFAQGLLGLERNWVGPLLTNANVDTTLQQFEGLLRNASPQVKLKWRFQQAIYRAYYDAYNRRRLLYETALEQQAMDALRAADRLGVEVAMRRAEEILERALTEPVAQDLRAHVVEMAEALYQSIRMQLSVPRYQAIAIRRGANLDLIDYPLNSRLWLLAQFESIRQMERDKDKLATMDTLVNWTNPGPGGFYDDLGQPGAQPHLVPGEGWEKDQEFRNSARLAIQSTPEWRMSWVTFAESVYEAPLRLAYEHLEPGAQYVVKVTYTGDNFRIKIRLLADEQYTIHDYMAKPVPVGPVQFDVPREATADGKLVLQWNQESGAGGSGRGNQVAEVWLMRKSE